VCVCACVSKAGVLRDLGNYGSTQTYVPCGHILGCDGYTTGINVKSPTLHSKCWQKQVRLRRKAFWLYWLLFTIYQGPGLTPVKASLRKDWPPDRPHISRCLGQSVHSKAQAITESSLQKCISPCYLRPTSCPFSKYVIVHMMWTTFLTTPFMWVCKRLPMPSIRAHDLIAPTQLTC
jgi:hypothetical protein